MAVVGSVAGTKFYIWGGYATSGVLTPPTTGSPDVTSPDVNWVEIGQIANMGNVMIQFSKIAVESVGDGYTRQIKGTQSAPTFDLVVNRKDDDPGQLRLNLVDGDRNSLLWFRVVDNDIISVVGTTTYFQGRVYSSGTQYGGVNDLKKSAFSIEIEPDSISTVAAS
jgi:hypothetical protein